ncbi:N-6 DNA methylase [Lonepinella sp. MS14436]|uniref:N-6 DNA methylase n=1 Tax=Lonepinella sp. MS14436 TaxID=3003619 RepID=UPI0036DA8F21
MLKFTNFSQLLTALNFAKNGNIYTKTFANGVQLQADFDKKELIYPDDLIINQRQTCNFSDPENFVVFECVHRLLEKGYQLRHIELEKQWSLGHTQKSGRADITVYADDDKRILMIIECKTFGHEYNNALKILQNDGGQLFSYWQQDKSVKWLSLYASDISENGEIIYKNDIINCQDDANLLSVAKNDDSILLYANAHNAPKLHQVWSKTYLQQLHQGLIFGEDSTAYNIGIAPLRKKDLQEFNPDDKIINQFEEILRHNAVSDKENAFNRLIALFITKLVDESNKDDNTEIDFQYKVGQDTYETLQDRLQQLYVQGMQEFMGEEIYYTPLNYAERLFEQYQGKNRKEAINDLKETIRKLKFYSNSDFAFKDVHNEELFLQNGKILVEMVQLFEKYKIVYGAKHQFLGDLFEQLLNKGFKQNEGQFFTPQPITRFIWDSLPLHKIIAKNNQAYPKVIDYACGSGHFLTEAVEAINAAKPKEKESNDWARDAIFGIEKDYRLARVSKVSMFMNGAGESNIIFGDGLDNGKGIANEQFDILVANPPYSVQAFKGHLKLKNNDLQLLDSISNNGGEIEVLFCERIGQLLKSGGVGAVILKQTVLTHKQRSYTAARELILNQFYIRAIVNFQSKTFAKTTTVTSVLFLEKMPYPPKKERLALDIANAILSKDDLTAWNDNAVYQAYLQQIGVPQDEYDQVRLQSADFSQINALQSEYLQTQFSDILAKIKLNKSEEKNKTPDEINELKAQKALNLFAELEQEKIRYFALTYQHNTLIINAPSNNDKQKEFLGYSWGNGNRNEGIQISQAGGKLYDDKNRFAENTLAHYIREMFYPSERFRLPEIIRDLSEYAYYVNTADMLDFSLSSFNKTIRTSVKKVEIVSKFPLVKLADYIETLGGLWTGEKPPFKTVKVIRNTNFTMKGELKLDNVAEIEVEVNAFNKRKLLNGDIIIEKSGGSETQAVGRVVLFDLETNEDYAYSNFTTRLRVNNPSLLPKFLHIYLNDFYQQGYTFDLQNGASGLKNLDLNRYVETKIPLPPLDIQQKIIDECKKVDDEYETSRMAIETYRQKIAQIFDDLEVVKNSVSGGK